MYASGDTVLEELVREAREAKKGFGLIQLRYRRGSIVR